MRLTIFSPTEVLGKGGQTGQYLAVEWDYGYLQLTVTEKKQEALTFKQRLTTLITLSTKHYHLGFPLRNQTESHGINGGRQETTFPHTYFRTNDRD